MADIAAFLPLLIVVGAVAFFMGRRGRKPVEVPATPPAKPRMRPIQKFILVFGGIAMLALFWMSATQEPRVESPQESAVKQKRDSGIARAQVGAMMLKKAMRDPESFKLESALVIDGTNAVCYEYRARNGFGGMNVGNAVLASDGKRFLTSEQDRSAFSKLWNKECANKQGEEYAAGINWVL